MRTIQHLILISATVSTGLVAGLLGTFACTVMPALRGADDRTFVDVLQRINVAIINPVFLTAFIGGLALTGAAGGLIWREDERGELPWIIAALALYIVMMLITGRINMPLNNQLDAAGDPHRITDLSAVRGRFEGTWVTWNVVRTLANVAAFCCLAYALILHGRSTATADAPATSPAVAQALATVSSMSST